MRGIENNLDIVLLMREGYRNKPLLKEIIVFALQIDFSHGGDVLSLQDGVGILYRVEEESKRYEIVVHYGEDIR